MKVFAKTDVGKVRKMNQDYYFITSENDEPKLFILADGMGGYAGGEIASKMSVDCVKNYIYEKWNTIEKSESNILSLLRDATIYANKLIYEKSKQDEQLSEMGTTLDICLIYNEVIYISHIGDSRVYKVSEDYIKQLTTDHTYVERLLKEGKITKDEAEVHPDRHMLLKALGCDETIEPDILSERWNEKESILLCSDGLTNLVKDSEIQNIILNDLISPEKSLVNMANDIGGIDNITVILIKKDNNQN